ncbi:MAG: hypothetical protein HY329_02360 [Chloroflexi bacterium]|nr:hypothetical protein [Chloroflexota bacterium]
MLRTGIVVGIVGVVFVGLFATGNWPKEYGESSVVGLVTIVASMVAGLIGTVVLRRVPATASLDDEH